VDYAQEQRSWGNHAPSIILVAILHLAIGYALVTGLARKVVEVIKAPIETKIIEEIKKPPPDQPPPPPKLAAPPPPFIPPPEINIQVPVVTPPPTITTVTTTPPPPGPPPVYTPPAPPAPPVQPAVRREYKATYCPRPSFPRQALRSGLSGNVTAHVHVAPTGAVTDVRIIRSTNRLFDREVIRAMSQCKYAPEAVGFIGEYEINFKLED
jgi:protein TonB